MSIKIIKNTMTDPIEATCQNCGSVIAYTYDDIQRRTIYSFLGIETTIERFVVCPVCKSNIVLRSIMDMKGEEND